MVAGVAGGEGEELEEHDDELEEDEEEELEDEEDELEERVDELRQLLPSFITLSLMASRWAWVSLMLVFSPRWITLRLPAAGSMNRRKT